MLEQILAACFVIGLMFTTVWVLRRKGLATANFGFTRNAREKRMYVLERLPLTPQHSLHLVQIDNELVLIGVSPSSCNNVKSWKSSEARVEVRELR